MAIVGKSPESGVRIDIARPREGGPPWRYDGEATTPAEAIPIEAVVSADGDVSVELRGAAPDGTAERVRLLVRAAYKHAREDGQPPPRRIVRWRAEVDLASPRRGG